MKNLQHESIELLKQLISIPSISKEENESANLIESFFLNKGIKTERKGNNVWVKNAYFDANKATILLNSHHDTVKANLHYTLNPFEPITVEDQLFGLGSNDAGGALVSLIACFLKLYTRKDLNYNIILAATAEEEISGKNGIESIIPDLGRIEFGIVGEPTNLEIAIAEKGLLVLDCCVTGKAGHAAREEGENAIYKALRDINWFKNFQFPLESEWLGKVKMTVTQINAGLQHNIIPSECTFIVDIRTTEKYSNQYLLNFIKDHVNCKVNARSLRLNSSFIDPNHPFVKAGLELDLKLFASPTLSDQALMTDFPTIKLGPGHSSRSHIADEYILISEIHDGIQTYCNLLEKINSISYETLEKHKRRAIEY